jgi:hemimethylated DNA binding protein
MMLFLTPVASFSVVRHREDRWRGVIADWCHKHSNLNNNSSNNNNTAASPQRGKTSLTTKSYKRVRLESFPSPVEDGNEKDDSMNSETTSNIEYSVILHSGDASNLGSDERVMARVSQSELELVEDENLLRIRSPVVDDLFTRFNASAGAFSPNDLLAYQYPCDDTVLLESKQRHNYNDDMLLEPSAQKLCDDIVAAVQDFAAKRLLKHLRLQDYTLSMDTNPLLCTVNDRLVALANGKISVLSYHNRQADSGASPTSRQRVKTSLPTATRKAAVLLLNELLRLQQHIREINAMRQQCKEQGHRIQYCLGEIVKHKVFGFRGIVAGWDATPTVDVRNWDGLQHIENPMELPFYYIVPDINDCIQAFNGPRPLRYVCQENLEACPENQKFIQVDEKMLGPHEWHRIATVRSRATSADTTDTSSSKASYMAPFEVRYNFGEDLQDDGLTQDCLSQIEFEFNRWHVLARNGEIKGGDNNENTDEDLFKLENEEDIAVLAKLSIQNLQSLLRLVDNQKDAVMLQDLLKEMRRAHVNPRARQEMEKGMEELTSGQAKRASETFRRIVTDIDPSYAEAWNKLATCEFLMARYEAAMQASSQALELDPDNVPAITGLGLIHMELKEYEKAAYHFEKTMAIDPWSPGECFQTVPFIARIERVLI